MNIIQRLTLRHMRLNKRRTLVTILGIIISVAMITAVSSLTVSFLDMARRDTLARTGNWQVKLLELTPERRMQSGRKERHKMTGWNRSGCGIPKAMPRSRIHSGKTNLFCMWRN